MRTLLKLVILVLAGAGLVVLLAWPVSWAIGRLWGLDAFHSAALALGVLVILSLWAIAVVTQSAWELPWFMRAAGNDAGDAEGEIIDVQAREPGAEPEGEWFRPCPCGSGRPFARCCGKRAFKKRSA
ncbi:MAG: SEC-C domain-containing protein [Planctomycetota bacterium]|nr:SEC-C domain-containing protein [Planctomycetota bacterium]